MLRRLIVTMLFLFTTTYYVLPQDMVVKFHHLTNKDGLLQNSINSMVLDNHGFLWIGTQEGLNRFDGYDFEVFETDPHDPYSIPDDYIRSMCLDWHGNIWIGTEKGLIKYDIVYETFIDCSVVESNNPGEGLRGNNSINTITASESVQNLIWIGTNNGFSSFNVENNKYNNFTLPSIDGSNETIYPVNYIMESSSQGGIIWIGTTKGLFRFNSKSGEYIFYSQEDGLCGNFITYLFEDSSDNLWIGCSTGLCSLDSETSEFTSYISKPGDPHSLSDNNVSFIYEDSNNNLWIGTSGGGLNLLNRELTEFYNWTYLPEDPLSMSAKNLTTIIEDRSGDLWIGTRSNGINKLKFNNNNFEHFVHNPGNINSISGNGVRSIIHDNNGRLCVGSEEGVSIFDEDKGEYIHLKHQPGNLNSLSSNRVRVIRQDKKGVFWVGTEDRGLNSYNPATGRYRRYINNTSDSTSLGGNYVRAIEEDSDGVLWVGTVPGGLNRLGPRRESFTHYNYEEDNPGSLNDDRVYTILLRKNQELWVGTARGLAKFDRSNDNFTRYLSNADGSSLSHHYVMGLTEDHQGNILIATYGGGIDIMNPDSETFTHYDKEDGLSNNSVYGILEDSNYDLWMSTNYGISKLNLSNEEFTNYTIADGLQENEFNSGAYYKSGEGKMYFGGVNGISSFFPENIIPDIYIPNVLIHKFQLFNKNITPRDTINKKQILKKSILETDTIRLTHRENVFSIGFVAIDLSSPENIKYRYILHNFDNEWNEAGKRRYVTYTNLPPGEYVFQVTGTNARGEWNNEGRSVVIIITPPWWKTTFFYILSTLCIIIIILMYIQFRIRKLKIDKVRLEARVEERSLEILEKNKILSENQIKLRESNATKDKFFSIIAHDLLNPFSNILGLSEVLKSDYQSMEKAELEFVVNQLDKTSKLTHRLLENLLTWSRSQRGKIKVEKVKLNLHDMVSESYESAGPNAEKKNISIRNTIPDNLEIYTDKFTMSVVVHNIVNNAIKFTNEGGSITISSELINDELKLIIQDTGLGMSEDTLSRLFRIDESQTTVGTNNEKGTGLGLIICKEFVEKNQGRIEVESHLNAGSSFIITLPYETL